jgi:hypothetical protein
MAVDNQSPFIDAAKPILAGEPTINDDQRAELWDTFHNTKNATELATKLAPLSIPDDTKQQLYSAKQRAVAPPEPIDRAAKALNSIANIDPKVLEMAEKYPTVAKTLITVAEKSAETAQGEGKSAGKEKTQPTSKKAAPLAQPTRPDGLQHLPPIPEGHHRVLASDGGVHDIPAENLEQARAIDPTLHVLNP